MADDWRINEGDWVCVLFGPGGPNMFYGEVLGTPAATGDCWKIRDGGNVIHYVQTFAEIQKSMKATPPSTRDDRG